MSDHSGVHSSWVSFNHSPQSTWCSYISCGWEGKIEVLTNLEAQWMTPRCLGHFDENADASESDSTDGSDDLKHSAEDELNYTAENDDSNPTVAGRFKQSKRKRTLPKKLSLH